MIRASDMSSGTKFLSQLMVGTGCPVAEQVSVASASFSTVLHVGFSVISGYPAGTTTSITDRQFISDSIQTLHQFNGHISGESTRVIPLNFLYSDSVQVLHRSDQIICTRQDTQEIHNNMHFVVSWPKFRHLLLIFHMVYRWAELTTKAQLLQYVYRVTQLVAVGGRHGPAA